MTIPYVAPKDIKMLPVRLNLNSAIPQLPQGNYTNDLINRVRGDIAQSRARLNRASPQIQNTSVRLPAGGGVHITGGLDQWIAQAYKILGIQLTPQRLIAERLLAMKESGGRANAVNRWDRNFRAGHPSKGVDQMIDASFRAHMIPGHTNIFNPVDNMISSIRYRLANGNLITPGMASALRGGAYRGY